MATHDLTQLQMFPDADVARALTPTQLQNGIEGLQANAGALAQIPREERILALVATCQSLLVPNASRMQRMVTECASESGWSEAMVRFVIQDLLRLLDVPGLQTLLTGELGPATHDSTFITNTHRATQRMLVPPTCVAHILAATVPTTAIEALVLTLAAGIPCLIRTSTAGRVSARFFLAALRDHAPELARHAAVVTWDSGDDAFHQALQATKPTLVVHGSDTTIQSIQRAFDAPLPLFGYGHRYSFGLVAPKQAMTKGQLENLAIRIATDASLFEGGGCMSPQSIFVLPPAAQPHLDEELAEAIVRRGFAAAQNQFPRATPPADVAARQMQECGVATFTGKAFTSPEGNALVWRTPELRSSSGFRHLHVARVRSFEELLTVLGPSRHNLSTAGVELLGRESSEIHALLASVGVRRICTIGRMQRPLLLRAHDGIPRVAAWFHACDVEG